MLDTEGSTVSPHLQCGGGHSGPPLGFTSSRGNRGGQQRRQRDRTAKVGTYDPGKERLEKVGRRVTCAVEGARIFFNMDNGMVASTNTLWLQTAFYMLTGIFGRVGLRRNVQKTGFGLPIVPGGRGPGRRGLQPLDDGRGSDLPVEATVMGPMYGVR